MRTDNRQDQNVKQEMGSFGQVRTLRKQRKLQANTINNIKLETILYVVTNYCIRAAKSNIVNRHPKLNTIIYITGEKK